MNKLKIGDKVQLSAKNHTWNTEHIVECYTSRGEFAKKDYEEIAMLLLSKARRVKLKGKVINYGATDDDYKHLRKYVNVEFSYKDMKLEMYCSEKDLRKL